MLQDLLEGKDFRGTLRGSKKAFVNEGRSLKTIDNDLRIYKNKHDRDLAPIREAIDRVGEEWSFAIAKDNEYSDADLDFMGERANCWIIQHIAKMASCK